MTEEQVSVGKHPFAWRAWLKSVPLPVRVMGVGIGIFALYVVVQVTSLSWWGMGASERPYSDVAYPMDSESGSSFQKRAYAPSSEYAPAPNLAVTPAEPGGTGLYAEDAYEARAYGATIRTRDFGRVCDTLESWKPRTDVVFEEATRSDTSARYRFKTTRAAAPDILVALKALDPDNLTENTEVVKKQALAYTGELEVLRRREALLQQTLADVSAAYDELVALSKTTENVKVLATVIDDKLRYLQELSRQRIEVSREIAVLAERMADLRDRIDFVYFTVDVTTYRIFDTAALRDTWVRAVRDLVDAANTALQTLTLGFLTLCLLAIKVVFFGVLGIAGVKYGSRLAVRLWRS